jgi:hypothetical protein
MGCCPRENSPPGPRLYKDIWPKINHETFLLGRIKTIALGRDLPPKEWSIHLTGLVMKLSNLHEYGPGYKPVGDRWPHGWWIANGWDEGERGEFMSGEEIVTLAKKHDINLGQDPIDRLKRLVSEGEIRCWPYHPTREKSGWFFKRSEITRLFMRAGMPDPHPPRPEPQPSLEDDDYPDVKVGNWSKWRDVDGPDGTP